MIKIGLFKTIHCCISGISHGVNKLQIVLKELTNIIAKSVVTAKANK